METYFSSTKLRCLETGESFVDEKSRARAQRVRTQSALPTMKLLFPSTALLLAWTFAPSVQAQPDLNQAPKAENPANRAARDGRRNFTPEQRAAIFEDPAKLREFNRQNLRAQLERVNVREAAPQEAILGFVETEVKARETLGEQARALAQALRGDTLTETQFAGQLNAYQGALEDNRERRETALSALKKQIDFTKNPRLEAMLVLMGAQGDGPNVGGLNWITLGRGQGNGRLRLNRAIRGAGERGGGGGRDNGNRAGNNPFGVAPPAGAPNPVAAN